MRIAWLIFFIPYSAYFWDMNYLSVERLTKSFGDRVLFEDLSFGLSQGEKVALVGVNGSGKSTLLKILTGEDTADKGAHTFRNGVSVGYLSQNPQFEPGINALEAVFASDHEELRLIKAYDQLLAKGELSPTEQEKLQELMQQLDAKQLWDYESQVKQILGELGIYNLNQDVVDMSGGQKKRVALAAQLIVKPDFLILDEPTNHLDVDTIEWLEKYLSTQNITLFMVTHDRYFLDRVCNGILELDNQTVYKYEGNYAAFLEQKAEREANEIAEVEKARNLMRKELDWMRRQPKARGTKAKYRVDAFYDLKDKAKTNLKKDELELDVSQKRMGGKILELKHISKSFGDKKLINDFSYIFKKGERIGVVGENGTGKSTFLNILTEQLAPDSGKLDKGVNTEYGYYEQTEIQFDPSKKLIDVVLEVAEYFPLSDGTKISASQFLNKFLFSPKKQHDYVQKLSGGEKRRLQLLLVLIQNPNFLILDEPTNDLDLFTLNILEEFLSEFQGCLMIVSHDRYFMDRLTDHLFLFDGTGEIKDFNGNYTDYREWKKEQDALKRSEERAAQKQEEEKVVEKPKTQDQKKLSYKEKREFELLEEEMPKLEARKEELEDLLTKGEGSHDDFANWGKELDTIKEQLDEKEMRWLELSERA